MKFSRGQWSQIQSWWRKAGHPEVFKGVKCFVCGKRFSHSHCPHTWEENTEVLRLLKSQS